MHAARHSAHILRRAISSGTLHPGQRLTEEHWSKEMGVSRNTLREAFTILESEGLLAREANKGVSVALPSVEAVRDLYRARRAIEPAALRWGEGPDPDELLSITSAARANANAKEAEEVARHNQRFHQAIVESTGSPSLNVLMEHLLARMRLTFRYATDAEPTFHLRFVAGNEEVARLWAEGERVAAADRLEVGLKAAHEDVEKLL